MISTDADNFMEKARRALTLPIRARCAELTVLFDRGSTLDLQNFFPVLVDNIFGPQGSVSWGLRIARDINEDFRQLQHFLSPCGPVFRLIYTLLKDPSTKYDFPVIYLPLKVQQILENFKIHPFYADLVFQSLQTKHVISLLLNPFDYYMFHFAYHLINPWHQRSNTFLSTSNQDASWNTVYYVLCCDYILHFLPTKPGASVLPVVYYNGKNPMQTVRQIQRSPTGSKLINSNLLSKSLDDYTFHQNIGRHPRNQIWRSESVLTIFVDLWLNNDQVHQSTDQINNSFNTSSLSRLLQYSELPSSEYMRILRVLIKQIHSFSASAKVDDTHLCELKKIALPMIEGKFYVFLRNLIHRWPLDGSFRLVLELWLTYIQPWRYTDVTLPEIKQKNVDGDENNPTTTPSVDTRYLPFIAQNLLMYVVIFQQLLPRFTRVDLVSPKMSVMLYRISKVFNQPNLSLLLKEVEQSVENNNSPSHSYNYCLSALPPLNSTSNWCTNTSIPNAWATNSLLNIESSSLFNISRNTSDVLDANNSTFMNSLVGDKKWSAVVKQRIFELEGPSFCYKPLFSVPPASEVFDLIIQIKKSIKVALELVEMKKAEDQQLGVSFLNLLKIFWETPRTVDEFTLGERLKVPEYLEKSLEYLKQLFNITDVPYTETENSTAGTSSSSGVDISPSVKFLSAENVRERIKKIKYEGDPDLFPIKTTEISFLVRILYEISFHINQNFRQKICELYYNQSYWGRLSRQFLTSPTTIYKYDKSLVGSPRIRLDLPPRISLRVFSSYYFWAYFIIGWILSAILGYSLPMYISLLILIFLIYKCIKAMFVNPVGHCYPTQGFTNISFNDSF